MATRTYTTVQGDTWDLIAYKVYGDEKYIGELMQNNVRHVDCVIFPSGVKLNIPELKISEDDTIPDWRRTNE